MRRLLAAFGLTPAGTEGAGAAPDLVLPGSPERCLERFALRDAEGRAWMLERLPLAQAARRQELALLLDGLARCPELGPLIPAYAPLPGARRHVLQAQGGHWMLSPHVAAAPLPRPGYLDDAWRGAAVARAILALQRAGRALFAGQELPAAPQDSLPAYRDELFTTVARHAPGLLPRLLPLRRALDGLEQVLEAMPMALAHGDLHPLNILWGRDAGEPLRALIDWEFAGARPWLYDAANCLGCAGFEEPSGLGRGFALGLVRGLRAGAAQAGPDADLQGLHTLLLATRLGWLSEWLRKKDAELLDLELDYLDLLLNKGPALARLWASA